MAHDFIEAPTLRALRAILNGGVMGSNDLTASKNYQRGKLFGLHGLTLLIGSDTVTFSDSTNAGLTLAEVKAAIEAGASGVVAVFEERRLALLASAAITVGEVGTANPVFGFNTTSDTVGTLFGFFDDAAPRVLEVGAGARADGFYAYVEMT